MREVQWRAYRPADAPALAGLMNAMEEHAGRHGMYTAEELQGLITVLVHDFESDSSMVFAPDGALVAAGFTTTPPEGGFRVYLTGGVHPQWRGRGLGRQILGRHLARAVQIHRAEAPDAAWVAEAPRIPREDEDSARLFRRFGLTPVRYWFEMAAPTTPGPTTPAPAATVPAGVRITAYAPEHEATVHTTHMESFAQNWAFQYRDLISWVTMTVRSKSFIPELSLLAFEGEEMIGYLLTYLHADPKRVYVGELGVRRPWRRRGLASAMLARQLDAAGRAGYKEVTLSVDSESATGAVGVYERAGFAVESSTVTYSIPLVD